jgi:hypothetical protein
MNYEMILKVADCIEATPAQFDVDFFQNDTYCGTTYCIGGWAEVIRRVELDLSPAGRVDSIQSQRALDLTDVEADELFYGNSRGFWQEAMGLPPHGTGVSNFMNANLAMVVETLRKLGRKEIFLPTEEERAAFENEEAL